MMWTSFCREFCVLTALFSVFLNQITTASEVDDTKTYLMDRHQLFRRTDIPDLSMRPLERRSLSNEEIIEFDDDTDFPARGKNVRMHSLFGRTIPIRTDKTPFAAKIFRIGGQYHPMLKAGRSFNDNGNYRDAMKRILLRMN